MKKLFEISSIIILLLSSSCVDNEFENPPIGLCTGPSLKSTKTIANIYSLAKNPEIIAPSIIPNTPLYQYDDLIEGYVISSDEGGNFYNNLYIQAIDGSKGFSISISQSNLYSKGLMPGKKVFLKLKGLAFANPSKFARGLVFGAPPTDQYSVDRIAVSDYAEHIIASCQTAQEDDIVHKIDMKQIGDKYLNTLIELDDAQFIGESATEKFDLVQEDGFDSTTFITQNGLDNLGVRTSRYANFAGYKIASGRGKIRGVLTRYNTTYQLILRTERDVKMSNPAVDYQLPIGNIVDYPPTFTENFENHSISKTASTFPNYINDAYKGSKYWIVASYKSNKYIQMSAYSTGGSNICFLAMPVTFVPGKKLSFKTKDGFYNGEVLKIYYSKDYVPNSDIKKAKLIDISSKFSISKGAKTGYALKFTDSGIFTIPSNLSGKGFFIFEYNTAGRAGVSSTIQIDDIVLN